MSCCEANYDTNAHVLSVLNLLNIIPPPAKRNIIDERVALNEALDRYESEGLQNGKLSYSSGRSCPDLGDLAVFGVLYSVRGLNAHNNAIQLRGGPVKEWYDRMCKQVQGNRS